MEVEHCRRWVIFLDIDGVLLPVPKFTFGGGDLSADCVHRLRRIIDDGCGGKDCVSIILSSTWRNFPDMIARLDRFIQDAAPGALPLIAGGTPNGTVKVSQVSYYADDLTEQRLVRDRVDEIHRWIQTHMEDYPEAIGGRWFAIDDMQLDVDERMSGHFLHIMTDEGLTDADVSSTIAWLRSPNFPTPEEAAQRAAAARVDPALKEEEIDILHIQRRRLEERTSTLEGELANAQTRVAEQANQLRLLERAHGEQAKQLEDARYRLALADFAKRHDNLRAAVELASTKSGAERKALDEGIRRLVQLLRAKKELEKKIRAQAKKQRSATEQ